MEQKRAHSSKDPPIFQVDEEIFKKSEEHFRLFVEALPQIIWTARADGEVDYCNQIWYDFTGDTRPGMFQNEGWIKHIHPDDQSKILRLRQCAIQTGEPYEVELRLWSKWEKQYNWFLLHVLPAYNQQGNIIKWLGTCTNINTKKQAEEKLLFHASLAHSILDAVVVTNLEGHILSWNKAAEALYGWKEEEVKEKVLGALLRAHYPEGDRDAWMQKIIAHNYWQGETRQQRKDGTWLDIQTGISVLRDSKGNVTGLVEIMRDITTSKQIARELQEREQQLQAAIELTKFGVWKLYLKSSRIECSARSKAHFGYPADADLNLEMIIERILPADRDLNLKEALDYKEEYHGEYRVAWPDGSLHWIALSGQGQYSKSGKPFAVVGVTLDITERKLEEQRKDSFIGMASHELKTPLTALKGFTQLLARQLKRLELEDQIAILARMDGQIDTMTALVNELMDVSKIQAEKLEYTWKMVDIDRLVKKVITAVQQTNGQHTIVVHGTIGAKIRADQTRLEQVLANLLTNALKYSPQATQVEVSLATENDHVLIKVRDYGLGIPAEERESIFGRFYRADTAWSRAISGMGMGLYIAREIVEKHGGRIYVESTIGEGSTFYVELPFTRKELE